MYFTLYPKVAYKVDDYDYVKAIDITSSTKIKNYIKSYRGIQYSPYIVKDGQRPDYVAYKVYGSEKYDWLVLLVNDITNIYEEWPKSSQDFSEYIEMKYGSIDYATTTIKSYKDSLGNVIDQTTYNSLSQDQRSSESYYEYELKLNENKAKIKLLSPALLITVESDIRQMMKENV